MENGTVHSASTRALLRYCVERGVRLGAGAAAPENQVRLAELPDRLSIPTMAETWRRATAATGDLHLGATVAAKVAFGAYGALDFALHVSETVGEALRLLVRHFAQAHAGAEIAVDVTSRQAVVEFLPGLEVPQDHRPASAEFTLALLLTRSRFSTGLAWRPLAVELRAPRAGDGEPLRRLFGAPIRPGASANRLVLPREILSLRHAAAHPHLRDLLLASLSAPAGEAAPRDRFLDSFRSALAAALTDGEPRLATLAQRLCIAERTLQRHLARRGLTFRALLDETRRQRAEALLRFDRVSPDAIADELAFSEPRAFRRAFRRWTGSSPGDYLRAALRE